VKVPVLWVCTGNLWDCFELIKQLKKPCTKVKEVSNNRGYEAESDAFITHFITKASSKGRKQCLSR